MSKLISYTTVDFQTSTHLKLYLKYFEERNKDEKVTKSLKEAGLLRRTVSQVWNAKDGGNYYALNKTGGLDTPMNSRFYNMAGKGNLNDLAKSQNIQMGGGKYTRKQRRNRRTKQNGGNPFKNLYRNVVYKGEQFVHGLQGKPQPVNPSVSVQPIDTGLSKTPKIGNLPPNVSNVVKQADAQVAGFN